MNQHQQSMGLVSIKELQQGGRQLQGHGPGLMNLGNTCFMNSCLQCLAYLPALAQACAGASRPLLHGTASPCSLARTGAKCACCMVENLVRELRSGGSGATPARPLAIFQSLPSVFSRSFVRGRQEDAHEFLLAVLDAVERDNKKGLAALGMPKGVTTLVEHLFCGRILQSVVCTECQASSDTYQTITALSLDIGQAGSVEQSLQQFAAVEVLDGENKYKCDKCKRLVRAKKRVSVYEEPNCLVIHLKRFDAFALGGKIMKRVAYPATLNLRPFTSHKQAPHQEPAQYHLTGVLVHQGGSLHSGHYYAFVRDGAGGWYCANDSTVYRTQLDQVLSQQAYLLFYTRSSLKELGPVPGAKQSQTPAAGPSAGPMPATQQQHAGTNGVHTEAKRPVIGPQLPPGLLKPAHEPAVSRWTEEGVGARAPCAAAATATTTRTVLAGAGRQPIKVMLQPKKLATHAAPATMAPAASRVAAPAAALPSQQRLQQQEQQQAQPQAQPARAAEIVGSKRGREADGEQGTEPPATRAAQEPLEPLPLRRVKEALHVELYDALKGSAWADVLRQELTKLKSEGRGWRERREVLNKQLNPHLPRDAIQSACKQLQEVLEGEIEKRA